MSQFVKKTIFSLGLCAASTLHAVEVTEVTNQSGRTIVVDQSHPAFSLLLKAGEKINFRHSPLKEKIVIDGITYPLGSLIDAYQADLLSEYEIGKIKVIIGKNSVVMEEIADQDADQANATCFLQ
jgi:hypothetical protein